MQTIRRKELYWQTFLIGLATATAFFLPFIVRDRGYFLYYGDFNVQQVPFYQMNHAMIRSGDIFWNWFTDLGVNFIGSYSFYTLGSPFFWLTLPFPNSFVPHLMGPLLILKFACASLTAYAYIRRFVNRPTTATVGALLYAFCGFSVYNIFFNHFHEAIVFFPLLLLGLELYMTENKKGVFALTVFVCAMANYFFFAGMAVFALIYWFLHMISGVWRLSVPRFFWLAFEAAAGVALAAFLLIPSFFSVIQNPRTSYQFFGYNAFVYSKPQLFLNIIEVFFFPPDLPARPVFFPGTEERWASLAAWMPMFGMTGVLAYVTSKKGTWLRRIIAVTSVMALIPILNSAFILFNNSYYARWFYMPVLMMALATAVSVEDPEVNWDSGLRWNAFIVAAFVLGVGFFPAQDGGFEALSGLKFATREWYEKFIEYFGLYVKEFDDRFWITCAFAVVSLVLMGVLLPLLKKEPEAFARFAIVGVVCVSVIYSAYHVGMGKTHGYDSRGHVIPDLIEGNITLEDREETYRVDVYEGMDNTGMFFGLPTIQAFHSIVPASVMEFYPYVGVERGVGSRPEASHHGLRTLLSVKYMLDYAGDTNYFVEDDEPKIPGFVFYKNENNYNVYLNENYVPLGFAYEYYMNTETCELYGESNRELMMCKALLLNDEQIQKYKRYLIPLTEETDPDFYTYTDPNLTDEEVADLPTPPYISFSAEALAADAAALRRNACSSFVRDNKGFTAHISLEKDNLVFFSVPYEDGWSAKVNGKPVEIEKVNVGFMAVLVPAGENTEIRFDYQTPGLSLGIKVSLVSLLLLILYLAGWKLYKRNRTEEFDRLKAYDTVSEFDELPTVLRDESELGEALESLALPYDAEGNGTPVPGKSLSEIAETAAESSRNADFEAPQPQDPPQSGDGFRVRIADPEDFKDPEDKG